MTKVVVNRCFGGFGLSEEAMEKLIECGMPLYDDYEDYGKEERPDVHIVRNPSYKGSASSFEKKYYLSYTGDRMSIRTHPLIVKVVEELGVKASGIFASLEVVDVPREIDEIIIEEYDGTEWVAETHETW